MRGLRRFARHALMVLGLAALAAGPAAARDEAAGQRVVTTRNADYPGFDLETLKDVDLDACTAACTADQSCRAFTYNEKARWCFLKSDFGTLTQAPGATAGRIVPVATLSQSETVKRRDELGFVMPWFMDEARALEGALAQRAAGESRSAATLSADLAQALSGGDFEAASSAAIGLLALSPEDPANWLALARAALGRSPQDWQAQNEAKTDGTAAVIAAYLRMTGPAERAQALALLGRAFEKRGEGRMALKAYRASRGLEADAAVAADYERALEQYGFRVVSNEVDADSASPRLCIVFSDSLKPGAPIADFVTVEGGTGLAIEPRDNQVCVEGLKHGGRYTVRVRPGLPAADDEALARQVEITSYVRDRAPWVGFAGKAYVLPAGGEASIPIDSVNADRIDAKVYRIGDRALASAVRDGTFLRQLERYAADQIGDSSGTLVWQGEIEVKGGTLNETITTAIPITEAVGKAEPGVYVIVGRAALDQQNQWGTQATQWFIVSDLGLTALSATDGVHAFVRSLGSAKALAGARVKLVATNDEVLGEATTDADGHVRFEPGLARGAGGMAPQLLVAETDAGDYAFLDLKKTPFDLADRGVDGRPAPAAIDAFLTPERGIYRPGETVHLTALLRDSRAQSVDGLPLTLVVERPDSVEASREQIADQGLGGYHAAVPLAAEAMRGAWRFKLFVDPKGAPIAEISVLVEDFEPDRLAFEADSPAERLTSGGALPLSIAARYLYGAPAGDLAVDGEVIATPTATLDAYPGYRFGLADDPAPTVRDTLGATGLTDTDGAAAFEATVPTLPETTRLWNAEIVVRVTDTNGRAVERRLSRPVDAGGPRLGIRPAFDGSVAEGGPADFMLVAIGGDGTRIAAAGVAWTLERLTTTYQWYRRDGNWNYEPITSAEKIADGALDLAASGEPAKLSLPVDWGHYRLTATLSGAATTASSVDFDAGWYVDAAGGSETPDMLGVSLDKPRYKVGDTAHLRLEARFAGVALVAVIDDRLIAMKTVEVPEGGTTVALPVTAEWGPGAYVTAALYRPMDIAAKRMPARALGLSWLAVDPGERKLDLALDVAAELRPREAMAIPVTLRDLAPGTEAYVTVAAVDVGILNLTGFRTPDPDGWYYGQRRLGTEIRDLYGQLIDRMQGVPGVLRSGGDGGSAGLKAPPPTQKLLAFHSGVVRVDDDGRATVSFDLPDFNGTVRVMAMAWSKAGVGHAEKDVIVRDPVVVSASLPRFMTPGDKSRLLVEIDNVAGRAGDYTLAIGAAGLALASEDAARIVTLAEKQKVTLVLPIEAVDIGDHTITVDLAAPDGERFPKDYALGIRPAGTPVSRRSLVALAPQTGRLTVNGAAFADFVPGTASATLGLGGPARLDVATLIDALDRYPYGCTEQIASRAMPLLYLNQVAATIGIAEDTEIRKRVADAIGAVLANQSGAGSFGLWGPGWDDLWLDAYVTDFLTRAKAVGYAVPEVAFGNAVDNLANKLAYAQDFESGGEAIAYALYVLARNGRAAIGDLRYYAETKLDAFATPLAKAQIGAGLALYGDRARAERVFEAAYRDARAGAGPQSGGRDDYGSALRDEAGVLTLAAETGQNGLDLGALIDRVSETRATRRAVSTQEQSWTLLAAAALMDGMAKGSAEVDGVAADLPLFRKLSGTEVEDRPLAIANTGTTALDAALTITGVPAVPEPAGGVGFSIARAYYATDGSEIDPSTVAQNDRMVVVLTVTATEGRFGRLMVTDGLPAGFEIENPNISRSGDTASYDWLSVETNVAHTEARTDRFLAAVTRSASDPLEFSVAYTARAVSPGTFVHPAATVEDMYDPDRWARTDTGAVEIVGAMR
ncbi:alpha-2-macroglobulin family protein [Prosthecomicrobium pneumaticum]|uniref:Apple domain-containing protein n=1 Tax=Prosthecomicrobium pneumaticum TaxID=81895 RepID=A0A7W9FK74_9HYPH|nr:alpha-2-macroglobulin family protein [Prosthecomicrobium pneumaticum]MBB5752351.1 hypothetical protein [Prosthecomicrobium pneumaticum]